MIYQKNMFYSKRIKLWYTFVYTSLKSWHDFILGLRFIFICLLVNFFYLQVVSLLSSSCNSVFIFITWNKRVVFAPTRNFFSVHVIIFLDLVYILQTKYLEFFVLDLHPIVRFLYNLCKLLDKTGPVGCWAGLGGIFMVYSKNKRN